MIGSVLSFAHESPVLFGLFVLSVFAVVAGIVLMLAARQE